MQFSDISEARIRWRRMQCVTGLHSVAVMPGSGDGAGVRELHEFLKLGDSHKMLLNRYMI